MHFHLLPAEGSLLQQVKQQIGSSTWQVQGQSLPRRLARPQPLQGPRWSKIIMKSLGTSTDSWV